ncbi:MAG: DUF72 domain-containing protein [Oscillatoriales cyanobacterium SM2_2_1]|nr:DUF72 domain-containing protein [Oscillatoriales cyanobacterium SM2_2_1]
MSVAFYCGCAQWGYRGWLGSLYPARSPANQFLILYSERFTAVEINATFYSPVAPHQWQQWRQQVPQSFRFCPKVPQAISHASNLCNQIDALCSFLEVTQLLGDRLGVILLQLPPSFAPSRASELFALLKGRSPTPPLTLEVRHPQWFSPVARRLLLSTLRDLGVGLTLLDTRPVYGSQPPVPCQKPEVPLLWDTSSEQILIRYVSHPEGDRNRPYWQDWIPHLARWLSEGKTIYWITHCPDEGRSPSNAQTFHQILQTQVSIPPLPVPSQTQLHLFM